MAAGCLMKRKKLKKKEFITGVCDKKEDTVSMSNTKEIQDWKKRYEYES